MARNSELQRQAGDTTVVRTFRRRAKAIQSCVEGPDWKKNLTASSRLLREESRYDRLRAWALKVESRRGYNKATIALANKLARIVWAVWKRDVEFHEIPVAAA